jgi:hypothetical protein
MCEVKTDALCVCESLRGTCAVGGALAGQVCAVLCWAMLLKFLVGVQAGLTKHCWKLCVCVCVCVRARARACLVCRCLLSSWEGVVYLEGHSEGQGEASRVLGHLASFLL